MPGALSSSQSILPPQPFYFMLVFMGRISTLNREDSSDPLAKSREVTGKDLGDGGDGDHALNTNISTLGSNSKRIAEDSGDSNIVYIGYCAVGKSDQGAVAVWAIKKIDDSGSETIFEWANGVQEFNNIWNDRESLTYEN